MKLIRTPYRDRHTGLDPWLDTKLEKAVIQIVHDQEHPSRLLLPVMKPEVADFAK